MHSLSSSARCFSLLLAVAVPGARLSAHDPPPGCAFLDDWDPLTANGGIDFTACGLPGAADTGSFTADHGSIVIVPGNRDDLGLGGPLGIASTANDPAQEIAGRNYRVRFDFIGRPGLATAAFFVRVQYAFDEGAGTIDAGTFSAIGLNFTFDSLGHDDLSDHIHDDVRGPCLAELGHQGRHQTTYPDFLMATDTLFTMTIDIEESPENGSVVLLAKIFLAGTDEPLQPFAAINFDVSQLPEPSNEVDHAFLAAAVGGGSLEIHDLVICDIPDSERRVQNLRCQEEHDGSVLVSWENPAGADATFPIDVLVEGEVRASVAGDATSVSLSDLPQGQVEVTVVNFSGSGATCVVGEVTPEAHFLRGDGNADGNPDLSDAVFVLNHLFSGGAAPTCLDAAETNGDGKLDISDAVSLLGYLFLGDVAPAAPFPNCGHGRVVVGCEVEHCPHG